MINNLQHSKDLLLSNYFHQHYMPREYECFELVQTQRPFFSVMINLNASDETLDEDLVRVFIEGTPDELHQECGLPINNTLIEKAVIHLLESDKWRWMNSGCSTLFIKQKNIALYCQ